MNDTNIYTETTFASDAFLRAILGQRVLMNITTIGVTECTVHQVDKYHVIIESTEGKFLLVSKASIIAVEAPDAVLPDMSTYITDGVTKIKYKASKPRMDRNHSKMGQPPRRNDVQITTKPRRHFDR